MPLQVSGSVGPQLVADGTGLNPLRQGRQGELSVSELHGRYYEQTLRRAIFSGSITGQVTTVGLATTYTGLCLTNPNGSPVNLVVNKVGWGFIVAFAAGATLGLMTGFNSGTAVTQTAAVTPRNQFFNGQAGGGFGLLASSATLPTAPTLNIILGAGLTGAITTVPSQGPNVADLEGSLILPPGAYMAFYTSTASGAAGGAFSFQWEEVPV